MAYSTKQPAFDPDLAKKRQDEIVRATAIAEGDAAYLHLTKVRGIDPETVLHSADLRMLPPKIIGRDATEFGLVSLLRPAPDAAPTGAEVSFIDRGGTKSSRAPTNPMGLRRARLPLRLVLGRR